MRQLYDREAREYDQRTESYDSFPGLIAEIERFRAMVLPRRSIADIGCGAGRDSQYFLRHGHPVTACDLSWEMLAIVRRRYGYYPLLRLVQMDMDHMPFRDMSFGGAWVCASLLHVPAARLEHTLDEILRVLIPGAGISISMKSGTGEGWYPGMSLGRPRWFTFVQPERFGALMLSRGFAEVSITPSGRYDWFVTEARRP
jgi:SAM-dependent methyltransferase